MKKTSGKINKIKAAVYSLASLALLITISAPTFLSQKVFAAQVTGRSIEMSNSNSSTSASAPGTNVSYQVGFTAPSNATIKGVVVDFCDNDPIIGDSCTLPTGFSLSGVTVDTTTAPDTGLGSGWTVTVANSNRTLELTNATGIALNNTNVIFTISGVSNPSTDNHQFWGRILTYNSTAGATSYAAGTEGAFTDYGGVALSTGKAINITAKVEETLAFCVYAANCGDDPSFTIGHSVGTTTVIDSSATDTHTADFSISTNAQTGATVRLKGDVLKNGANSILAAGASPQTINPGDTVHQFGVYISTPGTNITAISPYTGGSGTQFGFDTSTGGENVTTTYGDQLATLSGPVNGSVTVLTFGATASNTTPAGTYTAAEQLIATGKF